MNARRLGTNLALAAVIVSGTVCAQQAFGQQTVAKLKDLQGTVLVSQGDAMTAGTSDQTLRPGTRVVTSAGATVTVSYDKGCDVRLRENQRFTVRESGECAALIASVEGTGVGVAAGAGTGGAIGTGLAFIAVGSGIMYAIDRKEHRSVSPN